MPGIDTNVLVRYLVKDDPEQAQAARVLLEGLTPDSPGFICRGVVVELVWVLGRAYQFSRAQIAFVLDQLGSTGGLVLEAGDDVAHAATRYGTGGVDFSDLMILAAAERARAGPLYTFDRALARQDGAALVGGETNG